MVMVMISTVGRFFMVAVRMTLLIRSCKARVKLSNLRRRSGVILCNKKIAAVIQKGENLNETRLVDKPQFSEDCWTFCIGQ